MDIVKRGTSSFEQLPEDLVRVLVQWLVKEGGVFELARTNKFFQSLTHEAFVELATPRVVRRALGPNAPQTPGKSVALWGGADCLRVELREKLMQELSKISLDQLAALVPHFVKWIQSDESGYTPDAQKSLLVALLKQVLKRNRGSLLRHLAKRQIVAALPAAAVSELLMKPEEVEQAWTTLQGHIGAVPPQFTEAITAFEEVAEGLEVLPAERADELWQSLADLVGRFPRLRQLLFALAIHVGCRLPAKRRQAFTWILEQSMHLSPWLRKSLLEGLVTSLDCLDVEDCKSWCNEFLEKVTTSSTQPWHLMPACHASVKKLEPPDRPPQVTTVFEMKMPTDPGKCAAALVALTQWVEFLDTSEKRGAQLRFLAKMLTQQEGAMGLDANKANREAMARHFVEQIHGFQPNEIKDLIPAYLELILTSPVDDLGDLEDAYIFNRDGSMAGVAEKPPLLESADLLSQLFQKLCIAGNENELESIFDIVLSRLNDVFSEMGQDADKWVSKTAFLTEWTRCLQVVAFFSRQLPSHAFDNVSVRLIETLMACVNSANVGAHDNLVAAIQVPLNTFVQGVWARTQWTSEANRLKLCERLVKSLCGSPLLHQFPAVRMSLDQMLGGLPNNEAASQLRALAKTLQESQAKTS